MPSVLWQDDAGPTVLPSVKASPPVGQFDWEETNAVELRRLTSAPAAWAPLVLEAGGSGAVVLPPPTMPSLAVAAAIITPPGGSECGQQLPATPAPRAVAADFNGDGTSDLLLDSDGWLVDWIILDAQVQTGNLLGLGPRRPKLGDYNGDGTADMAVLSSTNAIDILTMKNGAVETRHSIATDVNLIGSGDLNADGTDDLILSASDFTIYSWIMKDGAFETGNYIANVIPHYPVATGDFDNDQTDDILLRDDFGGGPNVVVWIMSQGRFERGETIATGLARDWHIVGTGDFDGDGTSDVLLQNDGTVVVWHLQDGKFRDGRVVSSGIAGWNVAATGDYNGDGTSDIVLQNGSSVACWLIKAGAVDATALLTSTATGWNVVGSISLGPNGA